MARGRTTSSGTPRSRYEGFAGPDGRAGSACGSSPAAPRSPSSAAGPCPGTCGPGRAGCARSRWSRRGRAWRVSEGMPTAASRARMTISCAPGLASSSRFPQTTTSVSSPVALSALLTRLPLGARQRFATGCRNGRYWAASSGRRRPGRGRRSPGRNRCRSGSAS